MIQIVNRAKDYRDATLGKRLRNIHAENIGIKNELRLEYANLFNREKEIRSYDCSLDMYALEIRSLRAKKKFLVVLFNDKVAENKFIETVAYVDKHDNIEAIKPGVEKNGNKAKTT